MTAPTTFREWYERGYAVWPQLRNKQPAYDLLPRVDEVNPDTGEVTERPTWELFQSELPTEQMVSEWDAALSGGKPINIAAATGVLTGIVVVDIDDIDIAEEFAAEIGEKAAAWQVRTSRGVHFYFRHPGNGREIGNRRYDYGDRPRVLEIKGDGGCITLPGSVHADGTVYAFVGEPKGKVPPKLPQLLDDLIKASDEEDREIERRIREYRNASEVSERRLNAYCEAALKGECDAIKAAPFGQQLVTLNAGALKIGHLVGSGAIPEKTAFEALCDAGRQMSNQPQREKWKEREILYHVGRGILHGKREPRGVPESDRPLASRERAQSGNGADDGAITRTTPEPHVNGHADNHDGTQKPDQAKAQTQRQHQDPLERRREQLALLGPDEWEFGGADLNLVKGLVGHKMLAICYGGSGSGKTFTAVAMVMAIARGAPYFGRKTKPGFCVYISAEGGHSVHLRLKAYMQRYEVDAPPPLMTMPARIDMLDSNDLEALVLNIQGAEKVYGPCLMTVVDTVARSIGGRDENTENFGCLVDRSDMLRERIGCTVLLVHHVNKAAGEFRGSLSLYNAADVRLKVEQLLEGQRVINVEHLKDSDTSGAQMMFEIESVPVGETEDGDPMFGGVLVESEERKPSELPDPTTRKSRLSPEENEAKSALMSWPTSTLTFQEATDLWVQKDVIIPTLSGSTQQMQQRLRKTAHRMRIKLKDKGIISTQGETIFINAKYRFAPHD